MVTITMTEDEAKNHFSSLPKLYTVEDVAKEYHSGLQYIRDEIKAGRLNAIKLSGMLQMTAADVAQWIETKKELKK